MCVTRKGSAFTSAAEVTEFPPLRETAAFPAPNDAIGDVEGVLSSGVTRKLITLGIVVGNIKHNTRGVGSRHPRLRVRSSDIMLNKEGQQPSALVIFTAIVRVPPQIF